MRVVLVSTYELGRQPFGLASPAAWLRREGHEVTCADVSRAPLPLRDLQCADLIAFFLPMHTATRLFLNLAPRVRAANQRAHFCAYGLYAPLNQDALRKAGVETIIGGEFEKPLAELAAKLAASDEFKPASFISLDRQTFVLPDRSDLPPLSAYAGLSIDGSLRRAGYTEASRGCKHRCRHCPVVPVYGGLFRIVQADIVLEDIRNQVSAGAEHITFGDPDFLNGPGHAAPLVQALHREWPDLTYDVTIKIEHILKHRELLPELTRTGCVFVTSAVESLDDAVLEKLAKGHTRADFFEALSLTQAAELPISPTFIPFTPWTTLESYQKFLRTIGESGLAQNVAPIQLAIRLLIPEGSLLFDLPEIRETVGPFDAKALCYPWKNVDPRVDQLSTTLQQIIRRTSRNDAFRKIWDVAGAGDFPDVPLPSRATIPYLNEPWYC